VIFRPAALIFINRNPTRADVLARSCRHGVFGNDFSKGDVE
jgi:hypothetical protein